MAKSTRKHSPLSTLSFLTPNTPALDKKEEPPTTDDKKSNYQYSPRRAENNPLASYDYNNKKPHVVAPGYLRLSPPKPTNKQLLPDLKNISGLGTFKKTQHS